MKTDLVAIKGGRAIASGGGGRGTLAVLDEALRETTETFGTAVGCYDDMLQLDPIVDLQSARAARRRMWPRVQQVDDAAYRLRSMALCDPGEGWGRVSAEEAATMLAYVHSVLKKRPGDPVDEAAWLHAVASMFTPEANALARATRFAEPVPLHWGNLALTVHRILTTATFIPTPSEVRKATHEAHARVVTLKGYCEDWLGVAKRAELTVFRESPAIWRRVYTSSETIDVLRALARDVKDANLCVAFSQIDDEVSAREHER